MTRPRVPFLSRTLATSLLASNLLAAHASAQRIVESQSAVVQGTAPVVTTTITNTSVQGASPTAGHALRVDVTTLDAEGDEIIRIDYAWKRGTDVVGTAQTYTPTREDIDAGLILDVTAHTDPDTTLPASGTRTTAIQVGNNDAPVASAVSISGGNIVGNVLTAHYTYSDADGDAEGETTFDWCWRNSECGKGSGRTYTTSHADHGKDMSVVVTPKSSSGTPETGQPVQAHLGMRLEYPPTIVGNNGAWWSLDAGPATFTTTSTFQGHAASDAIIRYSIGFDPLADIDYRITVSAPDGTQVASITCDTGGYAWSTGGAAPWYPENCYHTSQAVDLSPHPRSGTWTVRVEKLRGPVGAKFRGTVSIHTK